MMELPISRFLFFKKAFSRLKLFSTRLFNFFGSGCRDDESVFFHRVSILYNVINGNNELIYQLI